MKIDETRPVASVQDLGVMAETEKTICGGGGGGGGGRMRRIDCMCKKRGATRQRQRVTMGSQIEKVFEGRWEEAEAVAVTHNRAGFDMEDETSGAPAIGL